MTLAELGGPDEAALEVPGPMEAQIRVRMQVVRARSVGWARSSLKIGTTARSRRRRA